jgi:tetratricopeptide (TPR) repeat protein
LNRRGVRAKAGQKFELSVQLGTAVKDFESAVLMFQKQNFERARQIFEKLAASGPVEVGSRASSYLKMCEQKLAAGAPASRSARDYYDLGIAQLNARELDVAFESLARADKAAPNQEYVRYALAAVCALRGDADAALDHLARAIELRPANRSMAAQDHDFQSLSSDSRFQRLIRSGVA